MEDKKPTRLRDMGRRETYQELRDDMLGTHGSLMWSVMDEYIHASTEEFAPMARLRNINEIQVDNDFFF